MWMGPSIIDNGLLYYSVVLLDPSEDADAAEFLVRERGVGEKAQAIIDSDKFNSSLPVANNRPPSPAIRSHFKAPKNTVGATALSLNHARAWRTFC